TGRESLPNYKGACYCNEVQFETKGDPLFTQICHCNKCRRTASQSNRKKDQKGCSLTAAYLYENFKIIKGQDKLDKQMSQNAFLYLCKNCHSLIYGISKDPNNQSGIGVNANNFELNTIKPPPAFNP